jgi:hypothetical protein
MIVAPQARSDSGIETIPAADLLHHLHKTAEIDRA